MTERPSRAIDLHGFALREFLQFVRKEDPSWIDGAQVSRTDEDHAKSGHVDGKVWLEVLMSECGAQSLARVLARAEALDENEVNAVLSLRKALRLSGLEGT